LPYNFLDYQIADRQTNQVSINGSEDGVRTAEDMIQQIVDGNDRSMTFERRNRNEYSTNNRDVSMDVPHGMAGRIIGKGGAKIRELESNSGARIKMGKLKMYFSSL
jgi:rRNA processing protein Krr1/Pno1